MKHIVAIILKFILTLVLLVILLSLTTTLSVTQILVISAAVTLISYAIGDMLILALSNNTAATICDATLVFLTVWVFSYVPYYRDITVSDAVVSAIVLGIAEIFFHKYVARAVFPNRRKRT